MEHVAVTGMGVISPIGGRVATFWQSLVEGRSGVVPIPESDGLSGNRLWAAVPDVLLARDSLPASAFKNTDRFTQYAILAALQAVNQAKLPEPDTQTAVIMGNTMGGFPLVAETQTRFLADGARPVTPKLMALVIPNMASACIATRWKLHGPQLTVSTACASSIDAIGIASRMIERGEVDCALAGGTETLLSPLVYESLARAGALSRNPDPMHSARPFDIERDGFIMGDGAGVLVLERTEHAQARGVEILARIRGYASLADAYHITSPDPSATYETQVMREAFEEAGVSAAECDVVYAHATGTIVGDAAEARAIDEVFSNRPLATSLKGHIGHSMAGAGVLAVIAGITGMHERCIPQTLGTQRVDPASQFEVVLNAPRAHDYAVFQANAFGFGGQNASLVISV
jgi:3-oxoacyl-[acyl-carrier-protein] synthase II